MTISQTPVLSIVVGAQNARSTLTPCLQSLLDQAKDQAIEILVVYDSTDDATGIMVNQFPMVKLIQSQTPSLVPQLWAVGIQQAKAPLIAITTANCIPSENWIASILETANRVEDSAGFGGAILPPNKFSLRDWAVYFTRYSAFMPPVTLGKVPEIAGDNAAYRKTSLDRCWKHPEQGFWETLFHHELRQLGESLYMSQAIEVRLGEIDNAWHFCQTRFRHGYHYGSTRPETSSMGKVIRIVAAPALMPFLILRVGLRVAKQRPDWILVYVLSLPWLVTFLSAWSLGEVKGYLSHHQGDRNLKESIVQ